MRALKPLKELKAKDLLEKPKYRISPDATISETIGKLLRTEERALPVVEGGEFLGMITLKNILKRRKIPLNAKVRNFIFVPPRIDTETPIFDIADIMISQDLRVLPVVKDKRFKGIVSIRKILQIVAEDPIVGGAEIAEIMNASPASVGENESTKKVARFMIMGDYRSLPVVDSRGKVMGIVGLKDIMNVMEKPQSKSSAGEIHGEKEPADILIKSITTPPITISVKSTIKEAVSSMLSNDTSILIIVDEGRKLIGVVTERDILEKVIRLRKEVQPFIQIAGVDEAHIDALPKLHDLIQKMLKKAEKFIEVIAITVRVKHHHHMEDVTKYTISLKVTTPYEIYTIEEWDWTMEEALNKCIKKFLKIIKKKKDKMKGR
ncbi:MAG: CBS domain-containing protein [Thermoplasmata archaeon]|nr:CBS domain-containing protein [Thermoplasmata archaeon]